MRKILFLCVVLLPLFYSCNKKQKDQLISLSGQKGLFFCADRNSGNFVFANRKYVDDWEKFQLESIEDNSYRIIASDFTYLGTDSANFLKAGFQDKNDTRTNFDIDKTVDGKSLFKASNGKYLRSTENDKIVADVQESSNAEHFAIQIIPSKVNTFFTRQQLSVLITGLLMLLASLFLFHFREKKRLSIILLVAGGFLVRFFVAMLDGYLQQWDEQFHALVAKNLMEFPFRPMLYRNPLIPLDPTGWTCGHIWLHKQPLFLWQMALSMKIFGVNTLALRLPSVVMSSLVIFFIYRIGKITNSQKAGFYGAVLFALANFTLEITAGAIHTDHNDIAFLFYVAASVWAWFEYESSEGKRKILFLILTGLFSGCAVLVKWMTGLLVYSGWGLVVLTDKQKRATLRNYLHILISLAITVIVFLPWQLYILKEFPLLSRYEYSLNSSHIFHVVESHGGNFWYHFDMGQTIYGISIFLILGSILLACILIKNKNFKIAFIIYIVIIYLLFSLAATKMPAFTYCVTFLVYMALGAVLEQLFRYVVLNPQLVKNQLYSKLFIITIISVISWWNLDIEKIQDNHTAWKKDKDSYLVYMQTVTPKLMNLSSKIPDIQQYVIFNSRLDDNIQIMFFNNVAGAYSLMPDTTAVNEIIQKGYKIAMFDDGNLGDFFEQNTNILKIPAYWKEN